MTSLRAQPRNGLSLVPARSQIELRLPDDPFLSTRFEEFYAEVVRLKLQFNGNEQTPVVSAQEAQRSLIAVLARQENEVQRTGTLLGLEMYRQAQRVMACLADEIFGAYPWLQDKWKSLEVELFRVDEPGGFSRGGQCIRKLAQLLHQDDPVYRELATVYFYALALSKMESQEYVTLLSKMTMAAPSDSPHLFAKSYSHTLAETKITFLPSSRKWWWTLVWVLLAWLALSWGLWIQVSSPVENQLHEIRETLQP